MFKVIIVFYTHTLSFLVDTEEEALNVQGSDFGDDCFGILVGDPSVKFGRD